MDLKVVNVTRNCVQIKEYNSRSWDVLTITGDEVALSLVPTDVWADMVTDILPYFLNPDNIKY